MHASGVAVSLCVTLAVERRRSRRFYRPRICAADIEREKYREKEGAREKENSLICTRCDLRAGRACAWGAPWRRARAPGIVPGREVARAQTQRRMGAERSGTTRRARRGADRYPLPPPRVHTLFCAMSMRHLCVVNKFNTLAGIITRKDLDRAAGHGWWRVNRHPSRKAFSTLEEAYCHFNR